MKWKKKRSALARMEQRAVNPSEGESKAKSITFVKSYNRKHDRREQSKEGGTQIQCWVSNSGEEHGDDRKGRKDTAWECPVVPINPSSDAPDDSALDLEAGDQHGVTSVCENLQKERIAWMFVASCYKTPEIERQLFDPEFTQSATTTTKEQYYKDHGITNGNSLDTITTQKMRLREVLHLKPKKYVKKGVKCAADDDDDLAEASSDSSCRSKAYTDSTQADKECKKHSFSLFKRKPKEEILSEYNTKCNLGNAEQLVGASETVCCRDGSGDVNSIS